METNRPKQAKIDSLTSSEVSGKIICLIFQKNGVIRINNKYITKKESKKFAKSL